MQKDWVLYNTYPGNYICIVTVLYSVGINLLVTDVLSLMYLGNVYGTRNRSTNPDVSVGH